ncbi:Uncharacterised protein [uncultured archaeon]|nr:Uncharacterised protein [uncultured archaeon]
MIISDRVYGKHEFSQPVITELINSNTVQRLKKISQYGMPDKYYHKKNGFTRYEHSIGVAILLAKSNAPLKEIIAGLLHDVSHSAFSHVIDVIYGDSSIEGIQDQLLPQFINSTEIKNILEKHHLNVNEISELNNFTLLEQPIPDLCADRIDYSLREITCDGENEKAKRIFQNLTTYNNIFCFKNVETAKEFGITFLKLQEEHWGGFQARIRYEFLGKALKKAIEKKIITKEDLYTDDETVLNKLEKSNDKEILKILSNLKQNKFPPESELKKKNRFVNPRILIKEKLIKLSEIDTEYNEKIQKYLK